MRSRSLTAAAVAAALAVPAAALAAAAPDPGPVVQEVSGTVAVPNPTKAGQNVTRPARTAGLVARPSDGVLGWFFEVDQATWGGQFLLTTATAGADLDVIFYSDPGTPADNSTSSAEFVGTDGDGEAGIVPAGTTHALIYAAAAPNADFRYVGSAPVQVQIGAGSLDVTVPVGGAVTWVNRTGDYTFVDGGRAFSSGTGAGTGIPVGKTFTATLGRAGTYTYTTSVGTGRVTVVN
jgi:plastocyanin